jgi:hypothetical protein
MTVKPHYKFILAEGGHGQCRYVGRETHVLIVAHGQEWPAPHVEGK